MKIIIHAGRAKTGTTAIQKTMKTNRERLLDQGVLYPQTFVREVDHSGMTVPLRNRVQRSMVSKLGSDYQKALEISYTEWAKVGDQVRSTEAHTVLISSEFLFGARHIRKIPDLIQEYFGQPAELSFLIYLRRPSEHYTSFLQQKLKAGHSLPNTGSEAVLRRIRKFLPMGDTQVRLFSRDALYGNDIVADFCFATGIDFGRLEGLSSDSNTSISAEAAILLQEYRRQHHLKNENVFTKDTQEFIKTLRLVETRNPDAFTKIRLRPEVAQMLDRETQDSKKIFKRFGIQLSRDHGVVPVQEQELAGFEDVEDVVVFDPDALQRMREALAASLRDEG